MEKSEFGEKSGVTRRAVVLGLPLGSALALASGQHQANAATQQAPAEATLTAQEQNGAAEIAFQDLNGFMWFYNTYFGYKFTDITRDLDDLYRDGIRVLGFFCPYNGDPYTADGCDPLDFYSVPPQNGTIQDWRNLVAEAHKRGMKVVCYFVNIYMDARASYFKTAEQQYWAGDLTLREVSSFHWTQNLFEPLPTLRSGPPAVSWWAYSPTADAFYWSLWFGPGFDFDLPGNAAEVGRIEEFWLDTGLDGFIWDVGLMDPATQQYQITLPKTYTKNPKWLTLERAGSANASTYLQYGLTSWYNYIDDYAVNDYTRLVTGAIDANGLEAALSNADFARENGCTTRAWSIWGDGRKANLIPHTYPTYADDDVMRVQEAALLAGAGIHYGCGMYDQYIRWSHTLRANWHRVLQTVNNNKALLPAASRTRVPAGSDPNVYAMRRTSADGTQTALLIYNFTSTAADVTVDLTGTGIATNQVPIDLYNGGTGPAINGPSYTVSLPAYGFAMLQVPTS
jgi:Alpha amylase, catalytic domain/Maltogenic Amylase, C-terminal domain